MTACKVETHAHTAEISPCGRLEAAELVRLYKEADFDVLVITDHFSRYWPGLSEPVPWREKVNRFFRGYELAREAAENTALTVLPAMEITLDGTPEDYLVYGLGRERLYGLEDLTSADPGELAAAMKEAGAVIVQAHPYRSGLTPSRPPLIQGMEVYNGNPRHDSQNAMARAWAGANGLIMTSGSDVHQIQDVARGGMVFDGQIGDMDDFLGALRSRAGTLLET